MSDEMGDEQTNVRKEQAETSVLNVATRSAAAFGGTGEIYQRITTGHPPSLPLLFLDK